MLTPASTNLISRVGDDFSLVISVTDGAGDPFDFTGCTGLFRVYNKIGATLLDKTSTGDAANVALTSGTITVTLPRDDSEYAALPAGEYRWEIAMTLSTGELQTWVVGDFVHQPRRGAPGTQSNTLSAEITATTVELTVLTPSTVIPLSQKGAALGVPALTANKAVALPSVGSNPAYSIGGYETTGPTGQIWGLKLQPDGPGDYTAQFTLMPRGMGGAAGATANALFRVLMEDLEDDEANYSSADFESHSDGHYYFIKTRQAGTGQHYPARAQVNGKNLVHLRTDGSVELGATSNGDQGAVIVHETTEPSNTVALEVRVRNIRVANNWGLVGRNALGTADVYLAYVDTDDAVNVGDGKANRNSVVKFNIGGAKKAQVNSDGFEVTGGAVLIDNARPYRSKTSSGELATLILLSSSNVLRVGDASANRNGSITFHAAGGHIATVDATGLDLTAGKVLKVGGTKVVGARVVNAALSNTPNSGDVATDALIDAIRDLIIAHGLGAAS